MSAANPDINALVFDKDGTLFDYATTWEAWAKSVLLKFAGADLPFARRLGAAIGFDVDAGRFDPTSIAIAGTTADIADALEPELPNQTAAQIETLLNQEAAHAPQSEAVPLRALLRELAGRGLRLGVATNDTETAARVHLAGAGVEAQFDFIAGYDSGFGGKPAPGQLLAFAEAVGVAPENCVMIGDSTHDLDAGRAAGMTCIGVLTGPAVQADLAPFADAVLPDIGHLPAWLDARSRARA